MDYINFKGATNFLGAPLGWNEDPANPPCGTLPVKAHNVGGAMLLTSYWKPSPAELEALNNGAAVRLDVFGGGHPPVYVGAEAVEVVS